MPWHCLYYAGTGIDPQGMGSSLALEYAPRLTKLALEMLAFQPISSGSHIASLGRPRNTSSSLS
jgi:hypothetical protein